MHLTDCLVFYHPCHTINQNTDTELYISKHISITLLFTFTERNFVGNRRCTECSHGKRNAVRIVATATIGFSYVWIIPSVVVLLHFIILKGVKFKFKSFRSNLRLLRLIRCERVKPNSVHKFKTSRTSTDSFELIKF